MIDQLLCILIKFINLLTNGLLGWFADMLIWILELLPVSPFQFESLKWGNFGMAVGYFIPIEKMLLHLARILMAVGAWYTIQHIIRFLRIIR